jgi:hypothetical protein
MNIINIDWGQLELLARYAHDVGAEEVEIYGTLSPIRLFK